MRFGFLVLSARLGFASGVAEVVATAFVATASAPLRGALGLGMKAVYLGDGLER